MSALTPRGGDGAGLAELTVTAKADEARRETAAQLPGYARAVHARWVRMSEVEREFAIGFMCGQMPQFMADVADISAVARELP